MCVCLPLRKKHYFLVQARLDGDTQEAADIASELLGVSAEALLHCLAAREVRAGNTNVTIYLTPEQAAHARDALAKVGHNPFSPRRGEEVGWGEGWGDGVGLGGGALYTTKSLPSHLDKT